MWINWQLTAILPSAMFTWQPRTLPGLKDILVNGWGWPFVQAWEVDIALRPSTAYERRTLPTPRQAAVAAAVAVEALDVCSSCLTRGTAGSASSAAQPTWM